MVYEVKCTLKPMCEFMFWMGTHGLLKTLDYRNYENAFNHVTHLLVTKVRSPFWVYPVVRAVEWHYLRKPVSRQVLARLRYCVETDVPGIEHEEKAA